MFRKSATSIALLTAIFVASASGAHAAKEKFERTKPHANVGTIGHAQKDGPTQIKQKDAKKPGLIGVILMLNKPKPENATIGQ